MKMENAFLLMAIVMAALIMASTVQAESTSLRRRASRFLAEDNPRAVSCRKNPSICDSIGTNLTCCNNKCVDLATEKNHCGRCGVECKYTQACCRGKCVYLTYDKRHCGRCNNRCKIGDFCIYGLCEYI